MVYSLVCVRFTNSLTLDGGGEAGGADPPVVILILRDGWQPVVAAAWALGRGDTGEAVRAGRLLAVAANSWLWHERLHAQDAASRDVRRRRLICLREAIGLAVAQLRSARAFGVVRLGLDAT